MGAPVLIPLDGSRLWRGRPEGTPGTAAPVQRTGLGPLDRALAQGGVPLGAVTEIRAGMGLGGMSLALQVCREALREEPRSRVAVVDGPGTLHAPGVMNTGLAPGVLWCIRPREPADAAAVALRVIRSAAFRVVVVDQVDAPPPHPELAVRRLSVAALDARCAVVLLCGDWADRTSMPLPAALRLRLRRRVTSQLVVFIEKQRGHGQGTDVPLRWPLWDVDHIP